MPTQASPFTDKDLLREADYTIEVLRKVYRRWVERKHLHAESARKRLAKMRELRRRFVELAEIDEDV